MTPFKKYVGNELCIATPVYKGHYNEEVFVMSFESKEWFDAELKGLGSILTKYYAPEVLDINIIKKEIMLKWKDAQNLNHAFYKNTQPVNWQTQVKNIIKDLESSGLYKLNLYPHTFYVVDDTIHVMDLHACIAYDDVVLESSLKEIINDKNRFQFNNGVLDIESAYKYTIEKNVGNWPGEFLDG